MKFSYYDYKRDNKKDIVPLYKIGLKEFKGEEWYSKKFLKDTLKRKAISYTAFEKNRIIGGIMVDILDKPKAWIFFFVIDKKYRRKGIGTKLLKKVEKNLPKRYYLLLVDFEKKDYAAIKFYKKYGFTEQAKIKSWFGIRHYGLIYEKILKNK